MTVVGGGPAGLAVSAELKARGVDSVVLERGSAVAMSWRGHYDRLRLHTTKGLSGMPGYPVPRGYPRWLTRDDVVRYLEAYAQRFDLNVRTGTTVRRIVPAHGTGWSVELNDGTVVPSRTVIVATGNLNVPRMPRWPGADSWAGRLLHAAQYRNAVSFQGTDVLVAGLGNTGAEIASDLADGGAATVSIAVRTPPHIAPRDTAGWPAQWNGLVLHRMPGSVVNTLARFAQPDLRRYGIGRPTTGLHTRLRHERQTALQDVGIVRDIKAGRVRPVAAVQRFTENSVLLADGTSVSPHAVIAATGYETGLPSLFDDKTLLDEAGVPRIHGGRAARPGLYFIGYDVTLRGALFQIAAEARAIARAVAAT